MSVAGRTGRRLEGARRDCVEEGAEALVHSVLQRCQGELRHQLSKQNALFLFLVASIDAFFTSFQSSTRSKNNCRVSGSTCMFCFMFSVSFLAQPQLLSGNSAVSFPCVKYI